MYTRPALGYNTHGGIVVRTSRSLRRLGQDIPKGTMGHILGEFTFTPGRGPACKEVRIRTEYGTFVVATGEYETTP